MFLATSLPLNAVADAAAVDSDLSEIDPSNFLELNDAAVVVVVVDKLADIDEL